MNWALLAVALVAACGDNKADSSRPVIVVKPSEITQVDALARTRQLIVGVTEDWSATTAKLQLWTRDASGPWTAVGQPWDAVIGRAGSAWGVGLHGAGMQPAKREGDGKAPAGIFKLRGSYGYRATPPEGSRLPYAQSDKLECVDDASSPHYTQILDGAQTQHDWTSSEQMKRHDALYTWVVDIAHNPAATAGAGSCIFFHVWAGPNTTTVGCTAMDESKLTELLQHLDPAAVPAYVLLPRAEYLQRQATWGLPPL